MVPRSGEDYSGAVQNVLVFGATSAIASEVVALWAARGERLYLVGRNPEKLALVAARCAPAQVTTQCADLGQPHENAALVAEAIAKLGQIDLVLIAHGELGDQRASEQAFASAEEILRVNLASVVSLLIPLANQLEAQRSGRIAVITSLAGDRARATSYTYAAAKGGLGTYLQGLRARLRPAGVRVTTLKLGPVRTPMTRERPKHLLYTQPERIAAEIVRAIDAGVAEAYVPGLWRVLMPVVRALPDWVLRKIR